MSHKQETTDNVKQVYSKITYSPKNIALPPYQK